MHLITSPFSSAHSCANVETRRGNKKPIDESRVFPGIFGHAPRQSSPKWAPVPGQSHVLSFPLPWHSGGGLGWGVFRILLRCERLPWHQLNWRTSTVGRHWRGVRLKPSREYCPWRVPEPGPCGDPKPSESLPGRILSLPRRSPSAVSPWRLDRW
jgi:hypothetical protein